jgi:proteasome accessory factor A
MTGVMKVVGTDFELSNTLQVPGRSDGQVDRAAALLLTHCPGYPINGNRTGTAIELGRAFLPNGSSRYTDAGHNEHNLAEHTSSQQHATLLHAQFRIARRAQQSVNAHLPAGSRVNLIANNTDGKASWGHHTSLLVSEEAYRNICGAKPHQAMFLATYLVTSNLFAGQGLVGSANGQGSIDFQLSQRAPWFETFATIQTTHNRPLINLRDEPHAEDLSRLHLIFHDIVLSPFASRLATGSLQLVVAMIEQDFIDPTMLLDDPVGAAAAVSTDMTLRRPLRTVMRGRSMTAVEIQRALAELAGEFVAGGMAEGVVPEAQRIVADWMRVLDPLERRDIEELVPLTDSWKKYWLLDRFRGQRGLAWNSPQMKLLDMMYGSLDPEQSLFYQAVDDGLVADMPSEDEIEHFAEQPPEDTRAWLRGRLLQEHGASVSHMDWSYLAFRLPTTGHPYWTNIARLRMPDPRRFTRREVEPILERSSSLTELVDELSALAERPSTASATAALACKGNGSASRECDSRSDDDQRGAGPRSGAR